MEGLGYQAARQSEELTQCLVSLILEQKTAFNARATKKRQIAIRKEQGKRAEEAFAASLENLTKRVPRTLLLPIKLASEKGASSWLTARPLSAHGTVLCKGDFRDALRMRFGFAIENLPQQCGCGADFSFEHAMTCMKGGFRGMLHNEVRDLLAALSLDAGTKI